MLEVDFRQWLQTSFADRVRMDEPLAAHTSLGIGGPAEAYVMVENEEELVRLVTGCFKTGTNYFILAGGTNLLVKDGGINGVVIDIKKGLQKIEARQGEMGRTIVSAGAGVALRSLCRFALRQGLSGLNFALGIPGTVGGAVVMNAGTASGSMGDVLSSLRLLTPGKGFIRKEKNEMAFAYRTMVLNGLTENGRARTIIVSAELELDRDDPGRLRAEARRLLMQRRRTQPFKARSAGCFFKNPAAGESAGRLIDLAGLKGKRIGDAVVSEKHANFIVNAGRASAADVLELMETVREKVAELFGVDLEPEVEIVGN